MSSCSSHQAQSLRDPQWLPLPLSQCITRCLSFLFLTSYHGLSSDSHFQPGQGDIPYYLHSLLCLQHPSHCCLINLRVTCPHLKSYNKSSKFSGIPTVVACATFCVSSFCMYLYVFYVSVYIMFLHVMLFLVCEVIHSLYDYFPYFPNQTINSLRSANTFVHLQELFSTILYTRTNKHLFIDL